LAGYLKATLIPTLHFDKNFLSILVQYRVLPFHPTYFFWQTTMEAEEMKHRKKQIIVNKAILSNMKKGC
jgi:hypothetical protein